MSRHHWRANDGPRVVASRIRAPSAGQSAPFRVAPTRVILSQFRGRGAVGAAIRALWRARGDPLHNAIRSPPMRFRGKASRVPPKSGRLSGARASAGNRPSNRGRETHVSAARSAAGRKFPSQTYISGEYDTTYAGKVPKRPRG